MKISKKQAEELAEKLSIELGDSWSPRYWENFGWHYSAIFNSDTEEVFKVFEVFPQNYSSSGYSCNIVISLNGESNIYQWIGTGETPTEALKNTLSKVKKGAEILHKVTSQLPMS